MIFTIGRQYGSGGREIGMRLAERMNIAYYDDLLLTEAARESGLSEDLIRMFDERPQRLFFSVTSDQFSPFAPHFSPISTFEQQTYLATHDTIQKLAKKGDCVLIGRCADYALKDRKDVINIFITAPMEQRIRRVSERNGISEDEAKHRIKKTDRARASYYRFYSSKFWGDAKSYDLCIDSSILGVDGTTELLQHLVEIKQKNKA